MPKRMIDDSLLDSRSLEVLSPAAQDAFPRFILIADDFGCFEINPVKLRALGWSRRPDVTEEMVEGWITEYAERQATDPASGQKLAPVAMTWTHVGRRYAFLTGWFGGHGQKRRAEYDPNAPVGTPGRHGSKRRTPPPPADLLAEVLAGSVRAVDGKPPGTDREPPGNDEMKILSDSIPAREMTGNQPGNGRDGAGKCHVPAPAVPVPVPVAVPDARFLSEARNAGAADRAAVLAGERGRSPDEARHEAYPSLSALRSRLAEKWPGMMWAKTPGTHSAMEANVVALGLEAAADACIRHGSTWGTPPGSLSVFAALLADLAKNPSAAANIGAHVPTRRAADPRAPAAPSTDWTDTRAPWEITT